MSGDYPLANWLRALKREWLLYHLGDQRFRVVWDTPPKDEWVALDCETTGLNTKTDDIIAIGAVRIRGNRLMTSERLELLVRPDKQPNPAQHGPGPPFPEKNTRPGLPGEEALE